MATHSSILTWRIPWTEKPGGLTVHSVTQSWTQLKQLSIHACVIAMQGNMCSDIGEFQDLWVHERVSSPGRAPREGYIEILGEQH